MNYPKVLIISNQSMHRKNGTGITLESLWNNWPVNKYKEVYFEYSNFYEKKYKNSCCINSLLPIRHFVEKIGSKRNKNESNNDYKNNKSINVSQKNIKDHIFMICDSSFLKYTKKIKKIIDDFNPDIIYTLGASVSVLKLSAYIAQKRKIPIIIHFMDNWPHFLQNETTIIQKFYKRKLLKQLKNTYNYCNRCIAISPFMAKEYELETGIKHISLMNSVDTKKYLCNIKNEFPKTFVYAGGLHLDRWKALLRIQNCLKKANQKFNVNTKMDIYCKLEGIDEIISKFDNTLVNFKGYVPHESISQIYESASVLIHCEDIKSKANGFFKYSISTKIPEYLATGKPILFMGPQDMQLTQYLKERDLSLVATNDIELEECINLLINNYGYAISHFRKNALEYVNINHNIDIEREKLLNIINDSIKERKR